MQFSTMIVLVCLVAAVAAQAHYEHYPAVDALQLDAAAYQPIDNTPAHERSTRTKRGFFLLKKKLLLGALGLKAAKVGAAGAGVAGVFALKKKLSVPRIPTHSYTATKYGYTSHGPSWNVEVNSWH